MVLRAEYSLDHPELNDFLFALIGEEKTGQPLTVLSALARLDVDPRGEAMRLATLPRTDAIRAVTALVDGVRNGSWPPANSSSIATRLVACLPQLRATSTEARIGVAGGTPAARPMANRLVRLALFAAFLLTVLWTIRNGMS